MITFNFCGTSHGEGYRGVISGLPNGFTFDVDYINEQLRLRKCGIGRSARQAFADEVVFDGFDKQVAVNGELHFFVANKCVEQRPDITAVRSGHSDVVGQARNPQKTVREIAELSSARNSVCYVVLGAICKQYLAKLGIATYHRVEKVGGVKSRKRIAEAIEQAKRDGNSLGGVVEVGATGVPMGLGEILPYTERLDAQIAANIMGIPSVKGISFGLGDKFAQISGVEAHDELKFQDGKVVYATNKCGGIVSGITTGGDILFHVTVKPVPTVKGVATIDVCTLEQVPQHYERADTCVVENVGVIAENILAYVLTNQILKQQN